MNEHEVDRGSIKETATVKRDRTPHVRHALLTRAEQERNEWHMMWDTFKYISFSVLCALSIRNINGHLQSNW